jgi:hypothetical protein
MKQLFAILAIVALLVTPALSRQHKAGDGGVLFTVNTSNGLSVDNVNGGVGFRVFVVDRVSIRATLGAVIHSGTDDSKQFNSSGALLLNLFGTSNTECYLGGQVFYNHTDPNINTYTLGGLLGVGFSPWEHLTLGAEYGLDYTKDGGLTTWTFGQTTGKLLLTAWL